MAVDEDVGTGDWIGAGAGFGFTKPENIEGFLADMAGVEATGAGFATVAHFTDL